MSELVLIPAILEFELAVVQAKLDFIQTQVGASWVQLDVMDGVFVTANNLEMFADYQPTFTKKIELHLMVQDPVAVLEKYFSTCKYQQVLVHYESKVDFEKLAEYCLAKDIQWGVALNLKTPIESLEDHLPQLKKVVLLGVPAGRSGQDLQPLVFEKVAALQRLSSQFRLVDFKIGLDGGVKGGNLKFLQKSGFDHLYLSSALWQSENWLLAWNNLQTELGF